MHPGIFYILKIYQEVQIAPSFYYNITHSVFWVDGDKTNYRNQIKNDDTHGSSHQQRSMGLSGKAVPAEVCNGLAVAVKLYFGLPSVSWQSRDWQDLRPGHFPVSQARFASRFYRYDWLGDITPAAFSQLRRVTMHIPSSEATYRLGRPSSVTRRTVHSLNFSSYRGARFLFLAFSFHYIDCFCVFLDG